jgi:hypothetical protein
VSESVCVRMAGERERENEHMGKWPARKRDSLETYMNVGEPGARVLDHENAA